MPERENATMLVQPTRCRIDTATGFQVLNAAQNRQKAGGYPVLDSEYLVPVAPEGGQNAIETQIKSQLPPCQACGLKAQKWDFRYTPSPIYVSQIEELTK